MNLPVSEIELLIGVAGTAATWLAVRGLLRSRDAAKLKADRAKAPAFIADSSERARFAQKRAAEALATVLGSSSRLPAPTSVPRPAAEPPTNVVRASGTIQTGASAAVPPVASNPWTTPKPSAARSSGSAARWIGPGEEVTIGGLRVSGGMIYVGKSLRTRDGREENCLVDPDLSVARNVSGNLGLHYWPSYASISATGRRAFLEWLSGGRRDPKVDVGLVFLFFYGLERRLFIDRALNEASELISEVERLLGIYGENSSFQGYAQSFLGAARLVKGDFAAPEPAPLGYFYEMPLATRVHLGRLLVEDRPIDAEAALLWTLGSPETRLRTPGQRCFPELRHLWTVRFSERNPAGLKVRAPQRRIKASYRAASGTFEVDMPGPHEKLPDIAHVTGPLQGLRDLLESCMTELDTYSRLLGRRPEARDGLEAAMLLPPAIRGTAASGAIGAARTRLEGILGQTGMALTTPRALATALGIQASSDATGSQLLARLSLILDQLDVGLEPDRRYGGTLTAADARVVAFRAAAGAPIAAGHTAFDAARVAMEIAVLAASADGAVTPSELEGLVSEARKAPRLEVHETLRLEAFVRSLAGEPPRIQAALKRAGTLPGDRRAAIASAAIGAVLADGQATADEVRFLERLHRTLQLPPEAVHAALHQRAASRDEPVTVAAEDRPPDMPLPVVQSSGETGDRLGGLRLDQGRLARIQAETSSVSALLADVFADDETAPEPPPPPRPPADEAGDEASPYPGLDAAHGSLLAFVAGRGGRVPLDAFETQARALRLLPGAAMETINDWGFSTHDEAVLEEDGDDVTIPDELLPSLAPN